MSIANYSDLQTAVANWLHRSDLTSIIPDLIMLGEKRIFRDVRSHEMETSLNTTISGGVLAVPTGFIGWKAVYINTDRVQALQTKSLPWIYENYPTRSSDRCPLFIARNGSNFEFGPYPDSGYTVKGTYYKRLDPVSSSWNALATQHPDLYLFATLCEASEYVMNQGLVPEWERKYATIVNDINTEAHKAEFSGAPLSMTGG